MAIPHMQQHEQLCSICSHCCDVWCRWIQTGGNRPYCVLAISRNNFVGECVTFCQKQRRGRMYDVYATRDPFQTSILQVLPQFAWHVQQTHWTHWTGWCNNNINLEFLEHLLNHFCRSCVQLFLNHRHVWLIFKQKLFMVEHVTYVTKLQFGHQQKHSWNFSMLPSEISKHIFRLWRCGMWFEHMITFCDFFAGISINRMGCNDDGWPDVRWFVGRLETNGANSARFFVGTWA